MLRLGPQLTFLSRVLRPVVVVAVAHKLYAERRSCLVSQQQQHLKTTKTAIENINHNEQNPTRWLFSAEVPSCGNLGFWSVIIRYVSTFSFIRQRFFFLGLPTPTVVVAVVMDQAQAIAMCAVRMAPVDESVSVQILHEADASSCRGR